MALDLKVSRYPVHRRDVQPTDPCPRCASRLQNAHTSFIIGLQPVDTTQLETFICGSDFGWFCEACPTIVLDDTGIERILRFTRHLTPGARYGVVGLADLASVPEEDRDLPLGDEDHPLPLIPFLEEAPSLDPEQSRRALIEAKKAKKRRQRQKRLK